MNTSTLTTNNTQRYMIITFGLALDDPAHPKLGISTGGIAYLGPLGLLQWMETHLGLSGHSDDNDYLRIEQFRQMLRHRLDDDPEVFYRRSFEADQFAASEEILSRRDELLLAGWNFDPDSGIPSRLACLAELEVRFRNNKTSGLIPGFADRFLAVEHLLMQHRLPLDTLKINEPPALLPAHWKRLFQRLQQQGVTLEYLVTPTPDSTTDLGVLQRALQSGNQHRAKHLLKGDGSLLLLRGKRETELAAFLATLLRRNNIFRPACLVPHKNRSLDNALIQEGLPSMGILSASLARPTLQVLKLIPVFLWHPIDPFKIMEFVSLSVKPLHDELADRIAMQMAQTPGMMGEGWQRAINSFWAELDDHAQRDPSLDVREIRHQYNFWFERERYDISSKAPKEEVIDMYGYLEGWAFRLFDTGGSENSSLLVLRDQARRIRELLETLPETHLTHLELERIVRTIYEPAPVQLEAQEKGHLPYVYQPHAFTGPVDELLWWNFVQREPEHFFSRWFQSERRYLDRQDIHLEEPREENARLIWQRKRPVLLARRRLILVIPEFIDGSPVQSHPLFGNLEARFEGLESVTCQVNPQVAASIWSELFDLPRQIEMPVRQLGRPAPFLSLNDSYQLDSRTEETFSSLESLFYYPYQWVFRHKLLLRKSSILSIVSDTTLLGNLAHRFFEGILQQDELLHMDRTGVYQWIDRQAGTLFQREGAVLLLYGREPERINFIKRIKYAAWSLVNLIQNNGWRVRSTEEPLAGAFLGIPLNGRADLVLEKDGELAVIDLKWRGAAFRKRTIRNEEELQLVLYSKLLTTDQGWAHTAYFIMERGQLIARNQLAFHDITPVAPESDHLEVNQRILDRMYATFRWRMDQIRQGRIEVRCAHTQADLEEAYGDELLDLLEMKQEDARWDDYRALIYLVN